MHVSTRNAYLAKNSPKQPKTAKNAQNIAVGAKNRAVGDIFPKKKIIYFFLNYHPKLSLYACLYQKCISGEISAKNANPPKYPFFARHHDRKDPPYL